MIKIAGVTTISDLRKVVRITYTTLSALVKGTIFPKKNFPTQLAAKRWSSITTGFVIFFKTTDWGSHYLPEIFFERAV